MGFLNPLFLLAGAVVLVPIFLHLFYRQESKTFTFPAIRHLLRTERDHARQIRTQQLLLLLLRAAIVILLVLLGARIHFPAREAATTRRHWRSCWTTPSAPRSSRTESGGSTPSGRWPG